MRSKAIITILCTFYFLMSTNVMARSTSLKGICPNPLVIQLDWQPESEHGGIYELVGNGYKIDKDKKKVIGPLMASGKKTGINVEVRIGGPPVGFQPAQALIEAVKGEEAKNKPFDLLMFGSESADSGNAQIGIRVAHGLDRPIICGLKDLTVTDSGIIGKRDIPNGMEVYETTLPAVVTIKEGINLPRYPSLRGRIKAKKKSIVCFSPKKISKQMEMIQLQHPEEQKKEIEILGKGADAAPEVVNIFKKLKLLK